MKHIEKAESRHLDKIITNINDGKFVIPNFQREFEWQPWDVNSLITSIFMDYFIGTLLLWKASDTNVKALDCEPLKGFKGSPNPEHIVLDGQQRLTAIYFAFFNPDIKYPNRKSRCYFFMNIEALVNENYEDAFYYKWESKWYNEYLQTPEKQYEDNVLPLEVIGRGSWKVMDWINGYKAYWNNQLDTLEKLDPEELSEEEISNRKNRKSRILKSTELASELEKVLRELLSDYNISYIELDKEISVAKVCDIFTHINSKGVPLNIFDLLNAILTPHEIHLKDMWRKVSDDLNYTDPDKMKIYIFQVMSILEQTYCSSKYLYYLVPDAKKVVKENGTIKTIKLIKTKDEFIDKWNSAVDNLKKTINSLKNPRDYGAINKSFVPYPSIIPALTAIRKHISEKGYKNSIDVNAKVKKWYWSSIFTQNYSSAVESTSAKDFVDIQKWFEDDTLEPENYTRFLTEFEMMNFKTIVTKGSAIYNAIFNLLILNEARDWYTSDLPEYDTLDDHHIVPASWAKGRLNSEIHSMLTRAPLSPETNRYILRDRLPNEYFPEMLENNGEEQFYRVLGSHLISKKAVDILMRNPFTKEDYFKFLKEREDTVKSFIKSYIIEDIRELPVELQKLNDEIEKVELKLRDIIANSISDLDYKSIIPPHIQDSISRRLQNAIKKNPLMSMSDFESVRSKMDYFDLQEYKDVIAGKQTWELFENRFNNKTELQDKFKQLGELRNSIRHSREVNEITILEGKAALIYFNNAINKK